MPFRGVRKVSGLLRAERCPSRPMPKPKTAAQRKGLAFQRKVGRKLETLVLKFDIELEIEPWFLFIDSNGYGNAVPDFLLHLRKNRKLIIETKLTWVPEARIKLLRLYKPIVERVFNCEVLALTLCRNLTPETPLDHLVPALHRADSDCKAVVQWLGRGPLVW